MDNECTRVQVTTVPGVCNACYTRLPDYLVLPRADTKATRFVLRPHAAPAGKGKEDAQREVQDRENQGRRLLRELLS